MSLPVARRLASSRPLWQPPHLSRWTGQTARYASLPSASQMKKSLGRVGAKDQKDESMTQQQKKAQIQFYRENGGPMFPGTFVPKPFRDTLSEPSSLITYHWHSFKAYLTDVLTLLSMKLQSCPNWTSRPKWQFKRGQIAPTAKHLWQQALEAFADGDRETIKMICCGTYAGKLLTALEKRNPRERTKFELEFNNSAFYPKLVTHRMTQIPDIGKESMLEQAVVAISSSQKAWRIDATTRVPISGSMKYQDKVEYVVLARLSNEETYEMGPWRIWGTTTPTTMEHYFEDLALIEHQQASQAGWKKPPSSGKPKP